MSLLRALPGEVDNSVDRPSLRLGSDSGPEALKLRDHRCHLYGVEDGVPVGIEVAQMDEALVQGSVQNVIQLRTTCSVMGLS